MILDTDKLAGDGAYREDMRHRFVTDHFFAAEIADFHDFSVRAHTPAVNLYFPKNINMPMEEQHAKKFRLHLDPRKTFKTTLNMIDSLQWLAAFSREITMLNESSTQPLAKAISELTASYFYKPKKAPPTILQMLFPEVTTDRWPDVPWNTPNRKSTGAGVLDKTVAFTSPKSSQSGWHPMVIKSDDVEDTENSGISATADVRKAVKDKCDQNENLLREGGYKFITGTRYHPLDWYASCITRAKLNPDNWEVLIRSSVHTKNGTRILPGEFPREDELELQFPEFRALRYKALEEIFYNNYESFACQQQNDPMGGSVSKFDPKVYDSLQIEPGRIPRAGEVYIAWRPRYGGKPGMAKYSEGAAARIVDGKVYVLDAWQGTYAPSGEAEKIVFQAKTHDADGVMIVAVPGSDYVMSHVRNEAARRNRSMKVQWLEFEEDDSRRIAAIEQLEPLMKVGRVMFSTAMSKGNECRNQFIHFGLMEEQGIIEAISKFADLVPISAMRANMSEEEIEWQRRRRDDALLSAFLGQQGMPVLDETIRQKTEAHLAAMSKVSHFGLPPMPGGLDG